MTPLIDIDRAAKSFLQGDIRTDALHPTSLTFQRSEFVAVTGPSGSGKSTFLNLLSGIDRPSAGDIRVDGTALSGLSEAALAKFRGGRIGIVFQFFELISTLSAAENVQLAMDLVGKLPRPQRRRRAVELLEQVGLATMINKLPSRLSGGEQQRVAIARALANDPPILVADEPTGNLDRRNAEQVIELFGRFAAEGRCVILATHAQADKSRFSRILHIADGRVAEVAA